MIVVVAMVVVGMVVVVVVGMVVVVVMVVVGRIVVAAMVAVDVVAVVVTWQWFVIVVVAMVVVVAVAARRVPLPETSRAAWTRPCRRLAASWCTTPTRCPCSRAASTAAALILNLSKSKTARRDENREELEILWYLVEGVEMGVKLTPDRG